jgi:ribosomal-protein-alanine N-acetyltransferase
MVPLKTDRLTLRPLVPQDAASYAVLRYHPEVAKWLMPADGDPMVAAHAIIERFATSWRDRGYAPWGVFLEGRLIGQCGLNFVPEFGETEVLWALHPEAWGQGYATEAARAALDFGFRNVGLKRIFAITKPDNVASQAVMKRLGLTYRHNVVYKGFDSVWFDINRDMFA